MCIYDGDAKNCSGELFCKRATLKTCERKRGIYSRWKYFVKGRV
jgi:hypothetical protein